MRLLSLLLVLCCPAAALASPSPWTLDDILLAEQVDELVLSPDGKTAVWVQSAMDSEKGTRVSNLYLSRLDGLEPLQLTRGRATVRSPRFSPDGKHLAFLSSRPLPEAGKSKSEEAAGTQLWLLSLAGGEPWPLTRQERAPQAFAWRGNQEILFLAEEQPELAELERKRNKDTSQVVEDPATPCVRLFRLPATGGEVQRVTTNTDWIDDFEISPDSRWAVTRHQRSLSFGFDHKVPPATFLHNLETGESEAILSARLFPSQVAWAKDSRSFYFTADRSNHPFYFTAAITVVYHFDLESRRTTEVPLGWERAVAPGASLEPTADGFVARLADGVYSRPTRYVSREGGYEAQPLEGEHVRNLWQTELSQDGTLLAYEHAKANLPSQWYIARLEGNRLLAPRQLTRLNPGLSTRSLPRYEVIRFTGARGDEVEGILRYPLAWREGDKYPLILAPHGGPAGADYDDWSERASYPKILWQERGAFVLEVNYHGSSDYGLEWVESIGNGRYYELEIPDLEAGVDHVLSRGLADPNRLATLGWSNGGILSAELITRTKRYKAASIGAADVEWISDWGNVDFGASFDNYYFGASPLENPQLYLDKSPFFRLGEVETPTIVFTGTEDRNVPPSQSWSLFRALQQLGKTEVKLVLFPGEPHGLRQLAHQRRKVEEELAWLDRFLFARPSEKPETLKAGSALERALARQRAARTGGVLGVAEGGVLAPETVEIEGLKLGRFEVTEAQFAAFDRSRRVPPGREDWPATGISFEQAKLYTEWLVRKTGKKFRLPTVAEAANCQKAARAAASEANLLDRWAGYAPSPEATAALRTLAQKLGSGALLSEVGRHDVCCTSNPVFDLAGNAAEWVSDENGRGKLVGGSADLPRDPQGSGEPGLEYRGLRVVLDESGLP